MKKKITTLVFVLICCSGYSQTAGDFYKRAVGKYKNKDYAGAIVEYSRAIDIRDNSAALYNNRGLCKYKLERYSDAISDYDKAIKADDQYAHAYFNKGNCHLAINEYEMALSAYDKAIKVDQNYKMAYVNRAKVFHQMEDYKSSIADLDYAIDHKASERVDKLYFARGNAYLMLAEYNKALDNYDEAIRLNPSYYKALINRGQCYIKTKEYEKAIADFTLSIRSDDGTGEGYYFRALARIDQVAVRSQSKKANKNVVAEAKAKKKKMELVCSDLKKAKEFSYGPAYDAIQEYCTN